MHFNEGSPIKYNPCIVLLTGHPSVGKSTIGRKLVERTNLIRFGVDEAEITLAGAGVLPEVEPKDTFLNAMRMAVKYTHMQFMASLILDEGKPVLLEGPYSHYTYHFLAREVMANTHQRVRHDPEFLLRAFVLEAPEYSLAKRMDDRKESGEFALVHELEDVLRLRAKFEPMTGEHVYRVDTGLPLEENVQQILTVLEPFRKS